MITKYRGRVEISCLQGLCAEDEARENVAAQCAACELSTLTIIDLEEKKLQEIPAEKVRPAKTKQKED